jgi:hypothetical protein
MLAGVPIACTVGGGYGDDALAIARRHVDVILNMGDAVAGTQTAVGT